MDGEPGDGAEVSTATRRRDVVRWIGLGLGPLLALVMWLILPDAYIDSTGAPASFSAAGRATVAVMTWMATWWLTETVDVAVTALLPLALFPLLGARAMDDAAAPYASDLIFLFMGGFLLALSMQRWRLDQRIAIVTLRRIGTRPRSLVGGFMVITAVLSAFVSNTATAAMMLPIALSVIALILPSGDDARDGHGDGAAASTDPRARALATCLLLGIAYAATLGGIATIVGTPPNLLLAGFVQDQIAPAYQQDIGFARWLLIGAPVSIVLFPLTWFFLTTILFRVGRTPVEGVDALLRERARTLGPMQSGEWITMGVFFFTAGLWITRPWLTSITIGSGGDAMTPFAGLTDPGIAMTGALLLFVIPADARRRVFVMNWRTARHLPWGILILFGGGLSLASAVRANGVAEFLGAQMSMASSFPPILVVMCVVTMIVFFTELTSNTATTATLLPILAALAPTFEMHPLQLIVPATLAASCAFMMPVATPPNAIVFGSGRLTIPQMCRAGLLLNVLSVIVVSLMGYALVDVLISDDGAAARLPP